jgi:peroxiredoxin
LQKDYDTITGADTEIIAISADRLTRAEYAVEALGLEFPILSNPDAGVIKAYGLFDLHNNSYAAPATFVVDRQGNTRWEYIGYDSYYDRPDNEGIIAQLQRLS